MEALWATILFSGFALEVIIRHHKRLLNPLIQNDLDNVGLDT